MEMLANTELNHRKRDVELIGSENELNRESKRPKGNDSSFGGLEDEEEDYDEDVVVEMMKSIKKYSLLTKKAADPRESFLLQKTCDSYRVFKRYFDVVLGLCQVNSRVIHTDADREKLVTKVAVMIFRLSQQKVIGNAHHILVLGPKGTGKTSILQAVTKTVHLTSRVISLYFDCTQLLVSKEPISPSTLIIRFLQSSASPPDSSITDYDHLCDYLMDTQRSVFLCMDEYHTTYVSPEFAEFRFEVYQMVNDTRGLFFICVAGSSPYLRALCYGKFDTDESIISKFKGYKGLFGNLNNSKTTIVTLGPLSNENTFCSYLSDYYPTLISHPDRVDFPSLFMYTGGNRRTVDLLYSTFDQGLDFVEHKESGLYDVHKKYASYEKIWCLMLLAIKHRHQLSSPGDNISPFYCVEWVSLDEFIRMQDMVLSSLSSTTSTSLASSFYLPPAMKDGIKQLKIDELKTKVFYIAHDEGALIYDDDLTPRVRFVYPIHFYYMNYYISGVFPEWFTPMFELAMRFPYGPLGIQAEEVIARGLYESHFGREDYHLRNLGVQFSYTTIVKDGKNKKIKTGISKLTIDGTDLTTGDCLLLKERPDNIGADIVYFNPIEKRLIRYQIKLGLSSFFPNEIQEVHEKLCRGTNWIQKLLPDYLIDHVLVISRPLSEGTKKIADELKIRVEKARNYLPLSIKDKELVKAIVKDWYGNE